MPEPISKSQRKFEIKGASLKLSKSEESAGGKVILQACLSVEGRDSVHFSSYPDATSNHIVVRQLERQLVRVLTTEGAAAALRLLLDSSSSGGGSLQIVASAARTAVLAATLSPPPLEEKIAQLMKQPCSYGYERALKRDDSYVIDMDLIAPEHGSGMNLILPLVSTRDDVWAGDCGVHSALFFSKLKQLAPYENITLQNLRFTTPDGKMSCPHSFVSIREGSLKFDGSTFFSSLDPRLADRSSVQLYPTYPFGVRWEISFQGRIFYKEFQHEGKLYAVNFRIGKESPGDYGGRVEGFLGFEIGFLEQVDGRLTREIGTAFSLEYSPSLRHLAAPRDLIEQGFVNKVGYIAGIDRPVNAPFPQGRLTDECIDLILTVWEAVRRGQISDKFQNPTLLSNMRMRMERVSRQPKGWWE